LKASQKNWGKKTKKTKLFPRVPVTRHSGKRLFPECRGPGTRGRGSLPRVLGLGTRGRAFPIFFKRLRLFAPSSATFLFRVPFFPECNSSPSATLGEDCLPRVPNFWHSGKHVALGEYCFSRSAPRNIVMFSFFENQNIFNFEYNANRKTYNNIGATSSSAGHAGVSRMLLLIVVTELKLKLPE
jgi:hypothetical protein